MNYNDQFDDAPRGGLLANIGPKAAFFIVLIALSFMVGVVWKLYSGAGNNAPQNVPIVRADSAPFKVTPDDPGGMEIRHKDSTLFSAIKKEREDEPRIENLLADDTNEEPMPRSQLFAGLNTEANSEIGREEAPTPLDQPTEAQPMIEVASEKVEPVEEVVEEIVEQVAPVLETMTEPSPAVEVKPVEEAPKAPVVKVEPKPEVKVEPKPAPKPAVKAKPKPAPAPVEMRTESVPVASSKQSSGEYYVQLASTKDKASAEAEWKKLAKKYGISDMSHRVETADLGAKGLYYRIQAGPVSRDIAQSKCAAIKKINPNGCLVKK